MINVEMRIVVPVFNAEKWVKECVKSIEKQQHQNYKCIVVNDASTDKTGEILDDLKLDERFKIVHNSTNKGALFNTVHGWEVLETEKEPEVVLIVIDGDDKLATPQSLSVVNQVYRKISNCLLTYGNYVDDPSGHAGICREFPAEVIGNRSYRKYPYISSHLRTFKSKLWSKLDKSCLIDPRTNEYFKVTGDLAHMIPLLEMAGDRFVFIPQTLYLYNRVNPISDGYIKLKEQWNIDQYIRTLPKYEEVHFE